MIDLAAISRQSNGITREQRHDASASWTSLCIFENRGRTTRASQSSLRVVAKVSLKSAGVLRAITGMVVTPIDSAATDSAIQASKLNHRITRGELPTRNWLQSDRCCGAARGRPAHPKRHLFGPAINAP